ncbi:MAG: single-stranded DNA-binding protein [Bacteroides sp.]|nr:MAG: single-stranded DNA-binding protein [Bacteroides sp.]
MSTINKVIIVGYLGKDPEVKHFDNGNLKANFPVATSETFISKDKQKITNTDWHNIIVWNKLAEIVEKYLHKGKLVYLEGKIKNRSWNDSDGNKKYITEIVADTITMLGKRNDNYTVNNDEDILSSNQTNKNNNEITDDDLPF